MLRKTIPLSAVIGFTLYFGGTVRADVPAPPVNQAIGMMDTVAGDLEEADCRVCHSSGVPDRHHLLYGQAVPSPSLVPNPDTDGDGNPEATYGCLSCHDESFTAVRDCLVCHNAGSPHHTTAEALALNCTACHGDLVDNPGDGHYIPAYAPSLVTPYRGLNGDGYQNAPYPTPDLASDGSGSVVPADLTVTEAGPPFFTVTNIGPLGTVHTRNEPAVLSFKPAGANNDIVIGSTHHGGEEYNVEFNAGTPLAAAWDVDSQTLTVTVDATQTAQELVDAINTAIGASPDVAAELGFDGDDPVADALAPEHYEPIGGAPPNSRGYGAGSCSYCHDTDGTLDANGDPAGVIWDNHTNHHEIMGALGGFPARCNICHDYATTEEQSGPNFNAAIRVCENCHGPDSLHNIQADSPASANLGSIVVGGELAGYGHVGRDSGPGDSDCWGCHGFGVGAAAVAPGSGPIIPTLYNSDLGTVNAGADTTVALSGSGFTNTVGDLLFESAVLLIADGGPTVTLNPDTMSEDRLTVTIPSTMAPGNYNLQAVKSDSASNPRVVSIVPQVVINDATADGKTVTINGNGFGGYAAGSGTAVKATATNLEGTIVSWTDRSIVAEFDTTPTDVTVTSVFGTDTSVVTGGGATFRRGDSNADGIVDLSDAVYTLNFLFLNRVALTCPDASDTNDSSDVDISDAILSLNWLFLGGDIDVPAPGPSVCGPDPTEDTLPACDYNRDDC